MKTDNPRELALKILNGQGQRPSHSENDPEDLYRLYLLDERDRAFVNNLVQCVLRWRLRLDWIIEQFSAFPLKKIDEEILNILRIACCQIFFMDRVPESAAVNEAVNLARAGKRPRHVVSFVNGVLRTICRRRDEVIFPDKEKDRAQYLSVFYSYPMWLTGKWIRELGGDVTEALFSEQNRIPDINIRTNTLRISRDALMESLARDGINARPLSRSPQGIILEGFRGRVDSLKAFRDGLFQVQDQAAQIASRLLSVRPGDSVLDICAGLGGKSSHLVELMGGKGQVIGLDNNKGRLIKLAGNAERLGMNNIMPVEADASGSLSSLFSCKFNRVILDAPCSGLGVISRHPDIKWNRRSEDIPNLAAMQKTFLNAAASVVEKGGELLYVVCTISSEENEGVVRGFLEGNSDMSLVDLKARAPGWCLDLIDDQGFYRTWPHIHHMDGFFAALFRKDS
jgi:16S rRNA (cytosine967-C5)-methyltransferase